MIDEEKACKAICNCEPCKKPCAMAKCYLGGLAEGEEYRKELVKDIKDLQEQIEKIKTVASSWIMSLEDVRASEVNNRRFEVLRELEKRVTEC